MNGPQLPDIRRYGDREIVKILKRAAWMQREVTRASHPPGPTPAELAEIDRVRQLIERYTLALADGSPAQIAVDAPDVQG